MASGGTTSFANEKETNWLAKLAELLEDKQPYEKMNSLDDWSANIDYDARILEKLQGSLIGLAVGDALGASVEFRPRGYLLEHEVRDMQSGGTWGLQAGQWTDDTSMALCLAASLIVKREIDGYDQFQRYKRWYRNGYMSSTGKCFDIGKSTREAITDFENRLRNEPQKSRPKPDGISNDFGNKTGRDFKTQNIDVECGKPDSAGNGPLMRLAPIPLFFFRSIGEVNDVKLYIDVATKLTHGDPRAIDACRFYAALIWGALKDVPKKELLSRKFFEGLFKPELHKDVLEIANGSYKDKRLGYDDGIRGKGYIVNALEAALWAFEYDDNSFEKGVLQAVNLGDDTDTTAAIYGELAGAVYGVQNIPAAWRKALSQEKFIMTIAAGLYVGGKKFEGTSRGSDFSDAYGQTRQEAKTDKKSRFDKDGQANKLSSDHQDGTGSGTPSQVHKGPNILFAS